MTYGDAKYPVFYTDGIPMKDIGDDVAFEAHIKGGEAGDTYSTSAANYFYSRLFKDGIINANLDTDDYKRMVLYKECLAYGASAQDVLVNIGNANPETLVTDYVFVWSADENVRIDGVNTSKTLLPNTSVTPVYLDGTITEWTLLDAEGVVVDTVAYGESIEITEHTEIVAGAVVEDTVTVMDYENGASNAYVSTKDSDSNTVSGAWATGDGLTMGTTTSGDNTYLQVRNTKNSNKTGITTVNFGNSVQTGNCYTFQTKVMIAGGTGGFNFARIKFVNNNGGEALNLMLGMTANASGATNKPHLAIATTGSNASIAAGTTLFDLNEKAVTTNNWCTIRVEFYFTGAGTATEENTYMKLYVDDVLAFDDGYKYHRLSHSGYYL